MGKAFLHIVVQILQNLLLSSQNPRSAPLRRLFLLISFIECYSIRMISTDIVQILDLVYSDNPVLACERLLERVERRAFVRHSSSSYPILGLPRWKKCVEVVV